MHVIFSFVAYDLPSTSVVDHSMIFVKPHLKTMALLVANKGMSPVIFFVTLVHIFFLNGIVRYLAYSCLVLVYVVLQSLLLFVLLFE